MPYIYKWSAWRRWLPMWFKRTMHLRPIRLFIQRGRKGYCDEDLWSLDYYLARLLASAIEELADTTHSHPTDMEWDDWQALLRTIASNLRAWNDDTFCDPEAFDKAKQGMYLVAEHFGDLWD